jgi:hypothetical protein
MTHFILTLDLSDHRNEHSPTAHRHIVNQLLAQASAAIGGGLAKKGEITHGAAFQQKIVGAWSFFEKERE